GAPRPPRALPRPAPRDGGAGRRLRAQHRGLLAGDLQLRGRDRRAPRRVPREAGARRPPPRAGPTPARVPPAAPAPRRPPARPPPPRPWFERAPAVLERPFYVRERLAGEVPIPAQGPNGEGPFTDAERASLGPEVVAALARLHAVDWRRHGFEFLGVPGR